MDEDIETLVVRVRADTQSFAKDVADMRGQLDGPLVSGVERAGAAIEAGLLRAVRTGKFGFEDLRRVALAAMADIASAALRNGIGSVGGGGSVAGGLLDLGASLLGSVLGLPGRATGGPVSPGQAYRVGERGPEIFVPTTSGRIEAGDRMNGARDVRVTINVQGSGQDAPDALQRSARQVARAVRGALGE